MNQITKLLKSSKCSPASMALVALSKFGLQSLEWDPLVIRDAFQDLIQTKLSDKSFDKLQAGLTMIGTNLFTASIQGFLFCTAVCNNKPVDKDEIPYASIKDICWSLYLYKELLGIESIPDEILSDDIELYIKELMKVYGLTKLPPVMDFVDLQNQQTNVQNELSADSALFESYNIRQDNMTARLTSYIADMQNQLLDQLKTLERAGFVGKQEIQNIG